MSRRLSRRSLLSIVASCGLLAACDDWLGETTGPKLPGKRVSILTQAKALQPDEGKAAEIILPRPDAVTDWPQAGGYPPHAMHHLELGDSLKRVWRADIGTGGSTRRILIAQPIVFNGRVYSLDADSRVASFDLGNGKRYWRIETAPEDVDRGTYGGGLACDEGKLFVTTGYSQLIAMDPETGEILWRQNLPSPVRGAPTARAGRIILVTVENETLCLSAEDGHQLWHHIGISEQASLLGGTSAAVDGNVVVVAYTSGEVFALRIENGTTLWSDTLSSLKRSDQVATLTDIRGLPVVDRGKVYAASNSDTVAAIDLRTGRRIWDKEVASMQTPWIAGDYLFVITNTPEITCFEAKTGRVMWVTPLKTWEDEDNKKARVVWTGPILASDRLIVVSSEGEALAVSPYSGELLGKEDLPDGVGIQPILADNTLIFITTEGELVAYR